MNFTAISDRDKKRERKRETARKWVRQRERERDRGRQRSTGHGHHVGQCSRNTRVTKLILNVMWFNLWCALGQGSCLERLVSYWNSWLWVLIVTFICSLSAYWSCIDLTICSVSAYWSCIDLTICSVSRCYVSATDLKFSQTLFGRPVPFATAGDCYSAAKCPQVGNGDHFWVCNLLTLICMPVCFDGGLEPTFPEWVLLTWHVQSVHWSQTVRVPSFHQWSNHIITLNHPV